jgi:enoyl-CoA hydratase/carnithine racemase
MSDYETVLYEERNGVAWVTLNRPQKYNAFNTKMTDELHAIWRGLRTNGNVRCAVLTGAGDKAFCTGIDRSEVNVDWPDELQHGTDGAGSGVASFASPMMHDDPGEKIGPKSSDLWKPVIAAVNGMACGGAFYMLGEADFVISAEHATFFDPHVDYGMAAVFEPIHMLQKMPFHEIMRLSLLGGAERMSAQRAHQIGLVSEVVAPADLLDRAAWAAETIASYPALAVQATVRALWSAREMHRTQALDQGYALVAMGTTAAGLREGQERFESGKRTPWVLR